MVGVGQTDGLQCLVRTYQNIEGQSFCKNYTMDAYQDQEGQFSCKSCSDYKQCTNRSGIFFTVSCIIIVITACKQKVASI